MFAALRNDRGRALLLCYVSSGAGPRSCSGSNVEDIDWPGMRRWVISKGTRLREPVPAEPTNIRESPSGTNTVFRNLTRNNSAMNVCA